MIIDRKRVENAFDEYVADYDLSDQKIALKAKHTKEVATICDSVASSLNMTDEDVDLAWLCGMLHDIGRFEQLKRYDTFVDAKSIDHANFGADLLFKDNLIERFIDDYESADVKVLENAIRCHSMYRIPNEYDERSILFGRILRDADKVDIFRVLNENTVYELHNATEDELDYATVTPEVMADVRNHVAILRAKKKTLADDMLSHVALVFELEFPKSMEITKEQGYLEKLLQFEFKNEESKALFDETKNIIYEFLG